MSNYRPRATIVYRVDAPQRSAAKGPSFICFYCRGLLKQGTGRRFRTKADGPVWEVHARHSVQPTEISIEEEGNEG